MIVLITLCCTCCNTNPGGEKAGKDTMITAKPELNPQQPSPDIETAETIVAGYYSDLNRKSGYPLYKGLEVKILKVYLNGSGQQMIDSRITGRKRNSPGTDTSTSAFQEQISFRAKWADNRWQRDTTIEIIR
jgi:hypothetical protein